MMPFEPALKGEISGNTASATAWHVAGESLKISNLPPFSIDSIDAQKWSLWRYAPLLPALPQVTLGEGMTPLVAQSMLGMNVHFKLEYLNPTGSFKDRGVCLMVNHLLAQGVQEIVEDSSGNAGASLAAYAAAAGLRARIFTPASAPAGKKALIRSFGADLVEIAGPRAATTAACLAAAHTTVYASHAWSPFFIAGQMTCAWEIWEQLGQRAPGAIVCPVGQGGLFLGLARGFRALQAAGLIDQLPRMFAVQSAGCDPIIQAWEQGLPRPPIIRPRPSLADGIAVVEPIRGAEVLRMLHETGGTALRVTDAAIEHAQRLLNQHGLLVEPTSAAPVAALAAIQQLIPGVTEVVIPLTGSGLKTLA